MKRAGDGWHVQQHTKREPRHKRMRAAPRTSRKTQIHTLGLCSRVRVRAIGVNNRSRTTKRVDGCQCVWQTEGVVEVSATWKVPFTSHTRLGAAAPVFFLSPS